MDFSWTGIRAGCFAICVCGGGGGGGILGSFVLFVCFYFYFKKWQVQWPEFHCCDAEELTSSFITDMVFFC